MASDVTPPGVVAVDEAIPLDGGFAPLPVLWWFPRDQSPVGVAWLQHGYARKPHYLRSLAALLAERGLVVVMPTVESFRRTGSINDKKYLDAIGVALGTLTRDDSALRRAAHRAGIDITDETASRLVLVAHSAGCAVVARAARAAHADDVALRGVVLLDATENLAKTFATSLPDLADVEVRGVFAQPSWCNRKGQGAKALMAERTGYVGIRLTSGTHCDAEGGDTDRVCSTMCGKPDPVNVDLLYEVTTAWTHDLAVGRPTPAWSPGGERLTDESRVGRVEALYGAEVIGA